MVDPGSLLSESMVDPGRLPLDSVVDWIVCSHSPWQVDQDSLPLNPMVDLCSPPEEKVVHSGGLPSKSLLLITVLVQMIISATGK